MRAGTLIALNSTGPMLEGLRLCYVLYKKVESWEEMPQSAMGLTVGNGRKLAILLLGGGSFISFYV